MPDPDSEENMPNAISLPAGFRTASAACGIKNNTDKLDLALFVSAEPATAAGVFTTNRVCGAPVKISRERVPSDNVRAVIINSGNANACTGPRGIDDARWMTREIADGLGCAADSVLVCSTGVIGRYLPVDKLRVGIPLVVDNLEDSAESFASAARAMMTTDTVPKQAGREAVLGGVTVRVSGVCKGAAMIAPNMATMLGVIMTDAALTPESADRLLRHAVDRSFNCISVEGHTSTSDSVILLANGAAGGGSLSGDDEQTLQQMLDEVAKELAVAIIQDAEGADHLITLDVKGLSTREEAVLIAKTIANDALVKTAITGADPNWGRIISCVGRTGIDVNEEDIRLSINGTLIFENGVAADYDEKALSQSMRDNRDVHIELGFPRGESAVRFWTCDLTQEYVRLNSDYTT